jgi:integrase
MSNYPTIYGGFKEKGIPESEIKPRENVFTYNAWRALGRQVRKGEHGVRVLTFIDCQKRDEETGQLKERFRRPFSTTVFHVSQTDEIPGGARWAPLLSHSRNRSRKSTALLSKEEHKTEGQLFEQDKALPKWYGWHAFRRGLATNLHQLGVADKTIQAILRHSNVGLTMNVYVKSVSESQVSAMDSLSEKLGVCNDLATNEKISIQ